MTQSKLNVTNFPDTPPHSCGLNSSRSRTAARAIIQCLEDSVSDTLKIQLLSELLTAMDTSYRSRRSQDQESGRRKRTRAIVDEVGLLVFVVVFVLVLLVVLAVVSNK